MGNITSINAATIALLMLVAGCASTPSAAPSGSTFVAPLADMRVSSGFGSRGGRPHYGLDLPAPKGTPVTSSADGRVSFAGRQRDFGKIVMIDHPGGAQTYYAHLSGMAVREGKRVRAGETIGFVGATGNATGPHLHFELRISGVPVDPAPYVLH